MEMVVTEVLALSTRCFKDTVPFRPGTPAMAVGVRTKQGRVRLGIPPSLRRMLA